MKFKRASIILLSLISSLSLITSCSEKNSTSLYEGTDPSTLFDGYYAELDTWNNYKDLRQKLYNMSNAGLLEKMEENKEFAFIDQRMYKKRCQDFCGFMVADMQLECQKWTKILLKIL